MKILFKNGKKKFLATKFYFFFISLFLSSCLLSAQVENELNYNNETYIYKSIDGKFFINSQPVPHDLNRKLIILKEYIFKKEKIVSINPVRISNEIYYPFFFYKGNLTSLNPDDYKRGWIEPLLRNYQVGWNIFTASENNKNLEIIGVIVLDRSFKIVRDRNIYSHIFNAFLVQYLFNHIAFTIQGTTKYDLGTYDLFSGSPPITPTDANFIQNITDSLLGKITFAPQEISEYFTEMLKGGVAKQRYTNILREILLKKESDYTSYERKSVLDNIFLGKRIADDFFKIGKYSKSKHIQKISKEIEKLFKEVTTVKDPRGGNRIIKVAGKDVTISWSKPLIDLVFALAEERVFLEERVEQLKLLLEMKSNLPNIQFSNELVMATREVIREAEMNLSEELVDKFVDFLLEQSANLGMKLAWNFLEEKWIDFVLKHTTKGSLSQSLLAGAAAQVALGFGISNYLWGMDSIYDSAVKARTVLDLTAAFKNTLHNIGRPISKFQAGYYYSDAKYMKALLLCLGLMRASFQDQMANIANSSSLKTWIVDVWYGFFGQKTMTDAIAERRTFAQMAEDSFEKTYLNNDKIDELIEMAILRLQKKLLLETGTALALIIDSTSSMERNDPRNLRISGGELVIDQGEDDWEIGIVDFDTSSTLLGSGSSQDDSLKKVLNRIDSEGNTNIQIGLEEGFNFLEKTYKAKRGAILLTDGEHNTPSNVFDYSQYVDIFTKNGWPVFTIGLTGDANEVLLSKIASLTKGSYWKAESYRDMVGIIDIILSQFKLEALVAYYRDNLAQGETKEFPFRIDSTVEHLNKTGVYPGSKIDFSLIDPQGVELTKTDLSKGVEVIEGKVYKIIKVKNPTSGMWKAKAEGINVSGPTEPFEIKLSVDSPIKVETREVKPFYIPYEPIIFTVDITGDVNRNSLSYSAEVTPPEGNSEKIQIKKDNRLSYLRTGEPGVYYFNIEVKGKKTDGEQFMRVGLKHIVVADTDQEFAGVIVKAWGSYIETNLGREVGLKPGKKIFVFITDGGIKRKIAEGHVISVYQGKSVVELTASWGSDIPKVGNRVEIDRSEF